jgi:hypothetical protein
MPARKKSPARATPAPAASGSPQEQLDGFMAKYLPEIVTEGRAALTRLRKIAPGAIELVYDNYNGLVVGFCPAERASEGIFSLLFTPRWLTLCLLQNGPRIPDPHGLLRGAGNQVRSVRLASAKDLDLPAVKTLIRETMDRAKVPIDPGGKRRLVIKSISAKQRPRRPKDS